MRKDDKKKDVLSNRPGLFFFVRPLAVPNTNKKVKMRTKNLKRRASRTNEMTKLISLCSLLLLFFRSSCYVRTSDTDRPASVGRWKGKK